jgi:hypothetical protein
VFATLFFIAFACFRSLAFGTMGCFAAGTAAGFFFGNFALFRFTYARVGERMSAVFYETITEGRSAKGMPPWKEILKADDIARILSFLESVQSSP